jgi:hypothetical protein
MDCGTGICSLFRLTWLPATSRQQTRFTQMSESIVTKVDQMGARLDDLEKSIADLMVAVSPGWFAAQSRTE